jgi:hypothetical protein
MASAASDSSKASPVIVANNSAVRRIGRPALVRGPWAEAELTAITAISAATADAKCIRLKTPLLVRATPGGLLLIGTMDGAT